MSNLLPRIDPEFKALIPPLSDEEYAQLEQNILQDKKCRDAIVVWNGILVDGYHRFKVCATHDIPFEVKEINFASRNEAIVWILDNQLGRRNLTDAMRIELAISKTEKLKQLGKENQRRRRKLGKSRPDEPLTKLPKAINIHNAVAKEAGVGEGTVRRYMQISKEGTPELQEKVKTGQMKINTAHRLLDRQVEKDMKRMDGLFRYIEKNIHLITSKADRELLDSRLAVVQKLLIELANGGGKSE